MPIGAFKLNAISKLLESAPAAGAFGLYKVLDNPNAYSTSPDDAFGISVAVSDNYAIVGAWTEDSASGSDSGKAYIYSTSTGSLLYTLDDPNAYSLAASDQFGASVGISNNYAIVGARLEDDAGGSASGKAYIYSTSTGSLLYTLDNPNAYSTSASDQFGTVAISDNYAIVGAPGEDDAGGSASGKAYIYSTSTGSLLYTLDNPNAYSTSASDQFGTSVAISNNYAIVGAYTEGDAGGASSGKAYIYSTSTGSLLYTLDNPNAYSTSANDYFGYAVAISDNYAIVGAYGEADAGGATSGKAYIYSTSTGSLVYTLDNANAYSTSANDNFGRAVGISNNYAIVGAYPEDDIGGLSSGKAYIYSTSTGSLLYTLDNPNAYARSVSDQFGITVGISDTYAMVGALGEDDAGGNSSGKAYMYTNNESDHISMPSPTGFVWLSNNSSQTTTITIPTTVQVGDIGVLLDTSTTTTDTTPTGWTNISKATTTGIRTNVSYKILESADIGATITGMAGTTRKILVFFRNVADSTPTVTLSTPTQQATTAAPTSQTITAGSGKSVYIGVAGWSGAATVTSNLAQTNKTVSVVTSSSGTSGVRLMYTVLDTGTNAIAHSNATVTMTDGGTNTLQSFRLDVS